MSDVADRIAQRRDALSPAERRVAEVVLRRPEGVAFGTVAEVAAVADTSGATVVRLSTRLGYQGFSDLQASIRGAIGARLRPAVERIRADVGPDVVGATLAAELDNVRRTLEALDPMGFGRAVELLADESRPVRVVAGDAQAGIGTILATDLSILRPDVAEAQGSPAAVVRRLASLTSGGPAPVLVAIDLHRYERGVVDAARQAVADGAALVAITDSPLSPLAAPADVAFAVSAEGAGPFDSHVGTLALVNALVTAVAARLRTSATARIDALESHWHTSGALLDS